MTIGDVLGQLGVTVVPWNRSLPHNLAEEHAIHFGEFSSVT